MTDQPNDTFVANDADDDPTLWLKEPNRRTPKGLISREGLRIAMRGNPFDPDAIAHVDRLWAAIAATAAPEVGTVNNVNKAPVEEPTEPTPEQVEAASAPEGAAIDALVTEFAPWDGIIQRQRLRDFAARVLEVRQQPGVPVEKVRALRERTVTAFGGRLAGDSPERIAIRDLLDGLGDLLAEEPTS